MKTTLNTMLRLLLLAAFLLPLANCSDKKEEKKGYQTVDNDPLNVRMYTLDNGLKVYLSVYKDAPRIQTYIATAAGSKNDPADATGLAHYLEHMVFKGTDKYGSKDFSKEEPLIKQIEQLYETYRATTDEAERKAIYHQIDSVSGEAAKYAIANEYDKMLSSIGAQGTNAYTWFEQTVYVNDIPSNQLEKWLTIEAERFRKPVLRLFHTELEAVYEEKNRSLDNDGDKSWDTMFEELFKKHSYGTQTTIGTIEHLKNPSLTKIMNFYNTYYVPNNMAICMSGDFNPDSAISMIKSKFGGWQRKDIPEFKFEKEAPLTAPVVKEVFGPDAENVMMGYRFDGGASKDADMITIISKILSNGQAGLIDLDLNQSQKVLSANAFELVLKDYSVHMLSAEAKEGQKLEECKDLLLAEIEKVKKGEFPDWLLSAIINDMKYQKIKSYESNGARADALVNSFILGLDWSNYVGQIDRLSKITKEEVMAFAKEHYNNNYVVVYKRTGEDKNVKKVEKPAITPVEVNRDSQSDFVKMIADTKAPEIEPVFLNFENDIKKLETKNHVPVLYLENKENQTFDMYYVLDMGTNNNKKLSVAIDYFSYLGTSKLSPEQVKQEFYKLGCSFGVSSSEDRIYVSLSGLSENFEKGLTLFEDLLADAQPNKTALDNLVGDILKQRADAKLNKGTIMRRIVAYTKYGKLNPNTNILSEAELKALTPEELIAIIKELSGYQHNVLYYGTMPLADLGTTLEKYHRTPETLKPLPPSVMFEEKSTDKNVFVVDYDMKQAEIMMVSKSDLYNKENEPVVRMYNEYFGGSMGSIVFQELRESKALAYSTYAFYGMPNRKEKSSYISAYIGSQADKLPEAMAGMTELLNNMPKSDNLFNAAKESIIQNIRTERVTKASILFSYLGAQRMGLNYDIRKDIFEKVPKMSFDDIKAFQETKSKGKDFSICVVGNKKLLDFKTLEKYGKVQTLSLTDVFGY